MIREDYHRHLPIYGKDDPDKPIVKWNRAEIVALGGDITYSLNGQKILEATDGSSTEGGIMFQSEEAEIFCGGSSCIPLRLDCLEPCSVRHHFGIPRPPRP